MDISNAFGMRFRQSLLLLTILTIACLTVVVFAPQQAAAGDLTKASPLIAQEDGVNYPADPNESSPTSGPVAWIELGKDTWGFKNYSTRISLDACKIALGNTYGWEAYQSKEGTHGVCYGFPVTVAAVWADAFPAASSFRSSSGNSSESLYGVKSDWTSSAIGYSSASSFIEMTYLSQMLPAVSRPKSWTKDNYDLIVGAAERWIAGGDPVIIHVRGTYGKDANGNPKGAGHALLPLRVQETADATIVFVYDCNSPNQEQALTVYKDPGGNHTGWAYRLAESTYWGSRLGDGYAAMYFSTPVKAFEGMYRKARLTTMSEEGDSGTSYAYRSLVRAETPVSVSAGSSTFQLGPGHEYSSDELLSVSDDGALRDDEQASSPLYWSNLDGPLRFSGFSGNADFGVANEKGGVDLELSDADAAEVSFDEADRASTQISQAQGAAFALGFYEDAAGEAGGLATTSLSGVSDGKIEASLTAEGVVVKGATSLSTSDSDGTAAVGGLDPNKSYLIDSQDGDGKRPTIEAMKDSSPEDSKTSKPGDREKVSIASARVKVNGSGFTFTGKALMPTATVTLGSTTLKAGTDYTLSYKGNLNAGTATVTATGKGNYTGAAKGTFTIGKAKNTLTAKAKSRKLKVKNLAKRKAVLKKLVTVKKAKGKATYKKASKAKKLEKFKVNSKTGAITVPKSTKKGTYKLKVKVTAKGDANYKSGSKTVTVKVVVR